MSNGSELCLRQGYQCKCSQCQIWIDRWNKELDAFVVVDTMMHDGKNLFQIYEWLRASQPDILRLHHAYIEKQYIEFKYPDDDVKNNNQLNNSKVIYKYVPLLN
jgi:hypothetical protein